MTRSLEEFPWPIAPASSQAPVWTGSEFALGTRRERVLQYDEAASHWSAELTEMHEAEAGATHPIDVASRQLAIDSVRRFAEAAPVVLDTGCSSAFLIDELRRAIPGSAIIGADYIPQPLYSAAARLPGVPLLQFDLRNCPLPDACVHVVTALNVLEHIDQDELALRQIFRILKPGGIAHIEVPAGPHLYDIYDEQLMHHRRYRLDELVDRARRAGFSVLRSTHLGAFVYPAFWCTKKRNRQLLRLPVEEKKKIIAEQIRKTSRSAILDFLLRSEMLLGKVISYPFGIRCVVVLRKT